MEPALVDDVIWGCVMQAGEQALDIARTAALSAGWPETVAGVTVDRQCGSSQQSLNFAVAGVIAGHYDVVVAGVSLVTNYREQFAKEVRDNGIDGLISTLAAKNKSLETSAAAKTARK